MPDFQTDFIRIGNKMKLLLKQQDQLRKENDKLRSGLSQQDDELQSLKELVALQQDQIAVLKAASGKMDDKSRQEFEKKIGQYIKDIDKVIVHLNG